MNTIEPKIKPLYRDLCHLNIGAYLESTEFDRLALKLGLEEDWEDAIQTYDREKKFVVLGYDMTASDREGAFKILLNWLYNSSLKEFYKVVYFITVEFLKWHKKPIEFEKIIEDFELIKFPDYMIINLKVIYSEKQKTNLRSLSAKNTFSIKATSEDSGKEEISALKKKLINKISMAEIEEVLAELRGFAETRASSQLTKKVVNLSSRYHRIKNYFINGTIHQQEKEIEINKINESLIDLINTLDRS